MVAVPTPVKAVLPSQHLFRSLRRKEARSRQERIITEHEKVIHSLKLEVATVKGELRQWHEWWYGSHGWITMVEVPQVQTVKKNFEVPQIQPFKKVVPVSQVSAQEQGVPMPRAVTQQVEKHDAVPKAAAVEKIVETPQVQMMERVVPVPQVLRQKDDDPWWNGNEDPWSRGLVTAKEHELEKVIEMPKVVEQVVPAAVSADGFALPAASEDWVWTKPSTGLPFCQFCSRRFPKKDLEVVGEKVDYFEDAIVKTVTRCCRDCRY